VKLGPIRNRRFVVTGSNGSGIESGPTPDGSSVVNELNIENVAIFTDSQINSASIGSGFASGRRLVADRLVCQDMMTHRIDGMNVRDS
jgi:hypothetical protein